MNITLRQLHYIVEASRTKSVTSAARSLNISTSSVLMAIDKFEEEFGIQVFVRQRSKGLTTTATGVRVIARAVRLLDEAVAFENDLGNQGPMMSGDIQIGCYSSISPNIVPQIIRQMRIDYSHLTVHLHEGDIMGIQKFLRNGEVDILLTYDAGMADEFELEMLASAPPHAVLAENDPLAANESVSLFDIAERPLLLLNLPQSSKYILSIFDQYQLTPAKIQKMETFEMARCSAAAGLGVAVLNIRPMVDQTYSGLKVVCRPIAEKTNIPNIVLATRKSGGTSRRANIFAQYCRQFFQTQEAQQLFVR